MSLKGLLLRFLSYWPPFFGAGVRIRRISKDFRAIDVEMVQRWYNTNYVGVHFGGSLYSMTDPFYMLMLMENLGPNYVVWDKSAAIQFKRPGRGKVFAQFRLSAEQIEAIQKAADSEPKTEPTFTVEVRDSQQTLIALVEKRLHVRRKVTPPPASSPALAR